jgi:hypothetical protein
MSQAAAAVETIFTSKGLSGVPQTFGMEVTSKLYLPPTEKSWRLLRKKMWKGIESTSKK